MLVPLCVKEGQPAILFNVRSNRVSTHKGQVAFPGGHIGAQIYNPNPNPNPHT